jgi:hypothetical protein
LTNAYLVFLSRTEKRPVADVRPIALSDPLPTIPVPLLPDDDDTFLDLQAAFTAMYDLLGYDLAVDYSQPPEVALAGEAAAWVEERLQAVGWRD